MSKKQKTKIRNYCKVGFEHRGEVCFLCGRTKNQTKLVIHHFDCDRNNNEPDNLFPLCDRNFGCKAHNHMGAEGLDKVNMKILTVLSNPNLKTGAWL